jgi:hypothetical protein
MLNDFWVTERDGDKRNERDRFEEGERNRKDGKD